MPSKVLPSRPSLDHLKHQAKDLLNAFKSGGADALARIRQFHPKYATRSEQDLRAAKFSLSDAQLVLAREYGFQSWPKLKRFVEASAQRNTSAKPADAPSVATLDDAVIERFLEYACPDHHIRGGPANMIARHAAVRLLKKNPQIARHSLFTAVVCGELEEVQRILAQRPQAASEPFSGGGPDRSRAGDSEDLFKENGPKRWEPLLFLCFARLPITPAAENAIAIARLLLDHGANPNAYFMAGDSRYTPLVGVIGEGEENRPPHPQREALTRLLLERDAEPYDLQVVYDIHFRGDILWFMKLIYEHSVRRGRQTDWADPNWSMLNMGTYGCGARWHLEIAIRKNDLELAEWLLAHGANPNAAPAMDPRFSKRTLYEEAICNGYTEMGHLLERYGANRRSLSLGSREAFLAACSRLDRENARSFLSEHPEFLRSPAAMFEAAKQDRADVAAFLLELGMSPDIADASKQTALHVAAFHGAARVAKLLVERGANVDPVDGQHGTTPIWWAIWAQQQRTIELLSRVSRDLRALAFIGKVDRLRELFATEAALARTVQAESSLLMWLPGDETLAVDIVKLFLDHGADPSIKSEEGLTAADLASKRGLDQAAELLRRTGTGDSKNVSFAL